MPDGILIGGSNFATTSAGAPKTVGEMFNDGIQVAAANADVFSQMEGKETTNLPFVVKQDLTKGGGNVVNFTTMGVLGGRGRMGEQQLIGYEEKPRIGSYNCRVEIIRHAVAYTAKMKAFLAAGRSLPSVYSELLGDWFGRKRQADMMIMLRNSANARNTYRVSQKPFDSLISSDTMTTSVINGAKGQLVTLSAKSCNLTKGAGMGKKSNTGAEIRQYLLFGTQMLLSPLKANSSYLTAAEYAQERGPSNTIFAGGYTSWDGNGIYEWNVSDPDTSGPLGAPILPRALLGTAIAADVVSVGITGSGVATPDTSMYPFDWFLGYDYPFYEEQTPNPDPNTHYVVILNVSGPQAGLFGVYSYLGNTNNGYSLTMLNRLGPAANGIAVTTLAGQTWNPAIHTNAHPTGSLIFQVNAKCTTIGWGFMFGAASAVRAYDNLGDLDEGTSGKSIANMGETGDYGMKKGRAMAICFGQAPAQDSLNQARNYLLIPCAVQHPEAPPSLNITS